MPISFYSIIWIENWLLLFIFNKSHFLLRINICTQYKYYISNIVSALLYTVYKTEIQIKSNSSSVSCKFKDTSGLETYFQIVIWCAASHVLYFLCLVDRNKDIKGHFFGGSNFRIMFVMVQKHIAESLNKFVGKIVNLFCSRLKIYNFFRNYISSNFYEIN